MMPLGQHDCCRVRSNNTSAQANKNKLYGRVGVSWPRRLDMMSLLLYWKNAFWDSSVFLWIWQSVSVYEWSDRRTLESSLPRARKLSLSLTQTHFRRVTVGAVYGLMFSIFMPAWITCGKAKLYSCWNFTCASYCLEKQEHWYCKQFSSSQ